MKAGIPLIAVGHASSLFLAITFTLCVGFDFLLPEHAMFSVRGRIYCLVSSG